MDEDEVDGRDEASGGGCHNDWELSVTARGGVPGAPVGSRSLTGGSYVMRHPESASLPSILGGCVWLTPPDPVKKCSAYLFCVSGFESTER